MTRSGRGWARRHVRALVASVLVMIGFAVLLRAGALPVLPPASALSRLSWWVVPAYVSIYVVVLLLRCGRWYLLLAPIQVVPLKRVLGVSFISLGALVVLPFRIGEIVRPAMIRKKGELSGWAATGTVGAERVIDGLVLSVLLLVTLPLAAPLSPLPDTIGGLPVSPSVVPRAAYSAVTLFGVAFVAMALFYFRREWAERTLRRVLGGVSARLAEALSRAVGRVASGLGFLPRVRLAAPYLAITLVYWGLNIAGTELLMRAAGLDQATFLRACVVTGVLALGILVPNAPGFFGAFQISLYAGLALFFPPDVVVGAGAVFVFVAYVIQMVTMLVLALASLMLEHVSTSDVVAAELDVE